ncbi:MAG: WXG100 family type VII secretion target [Sporichthyaceae bacterium]
MIDCVVHGDSAQCRSVAAELERQARRLSDAEAEVDRVVAKSRRVWEGESARRFAAFASGVRDSVEELKRRSFQFADALTVFAEELDRVCRDIGHAKDLAREHGLIVDEQGIAPPTTASAASHLLPSGAACVPVPPTYSQCLAIVDGARERERAAHDALQDAAAKVTRDPPLLHWLGKLGLVPTSDTAAGVALWAGNSGLFAVGAVADWATKVKYGELPFRASGRVSPTYWREVRAGLRPSNWVARPDAEVLHARWTTVGRAANVAGAVVAGSTAGWNQWHADQDDPTVEATEQVARATTAGVATGAGAWAGAVGGAQLGAALGTPLGPAGTIVGGVVGGAVGAALGTAAGEFVGDRIKGVVGDATDGAVELGKDAVSFFKKGKFW